VWGQRSAKRRDRDMYVALEIRRSHVARHGVKLRRDPLRTLLSVARQLGDILWGAFLEPDV